MDQNGKANGAAGDGANIGDGDASHPLDLRDVVVVTRDDGSETRFEVVGIVEDDDDNSFAVCYAETSDEFIVTDEAGELLQDEELAQEILDDFFVLAEESEGGTEGEA